MGRASFFYANPFYEGIVAAPYGPMIGQPVPPMMGVQEARVPLPSEMMEEGPVYVNAKQYHGILRRRQSRAKAEQENKLVKARKPYLHESRHLHALKRTRGNGGRFLNTKAKEKEPVKAEQRHRNSNAQSSNAAGVLPSPVQDTSYLSHLQNRGYPNHHQEQVYSHPQNRGYSDHHQEQVYNHPQNRGYPNHHQEQVMYNGSAFSAGGVPGTATELIQ